MECQLRCQYDSACPFFMFHFLYEQQYYINMSQVLLIPVHSDYKYT